MLCLTTAVGWEARFEKTELPVIAWVLVDESCSKAKGGSVQFTEGLCLEPGSTEGPTPATWYANKEGFGKFVGYYPV